MLLCDIEHTYLNHLQGLCVFSDLAMIRRLQIFYNLHVDFSMTIFLNELETLLFKRNIFLICVAMGERVY